jgi:hypothetical protein
MLAADKAALETELQKKALEIQDKELTFYVSNFATIATEGALLAGFSFSGLTLVTFTGVEGTSMPFKMAYYACTTFSMCFQLVAVLMSTLVSLRSTASRPRCLV